MEIALWENDLDTAWQMIQQERCRRELFLFLAGKLEKPRPGDAVTLYRRIIPGIIEETNNRAYEEAVRYLVKVGGLMQTSETAADFATYLAGLRAQYKAKRNFIKLLDGLSHWGIRGLVIAPKYWQGARKGGRLVRLSPVAGPGREVSSESAWLSCRLGRNQR